MLDKAEYSAFESTLNSPIVSYRILRKRQRLRKRGHVNDANVLSAKINELIRDFRAKQLSKLSDASSKDLWAAVNGENNTSNTSHATYASVDSFNNYFASVCTDSTYDLDDVLYYYKHHLVPHNNDLTVSVFDVERMLSKRNPVPRVLTLYHGGSTITVKMN